MNYSEKQIKILSIASNLRRIVQLTADNKSNMNDKLIIDFNNQSVEIFKSLDNSIVEKSEDLKLLGDLLYQIKYGFPVNNYECAEKSLAFYNILVNRILLY